MSEQSNTMIEKFDAETIQQARERFGYDDAEKQYKIRDLCDVLLPDRTPDTASRLIRKEVRAIQDAAGIEAPSGQYKFTADEAAVLSLQIQEKFSKYDEKQFISKEKSSLSESEDTAEKVVDGVEKKAENEQDSAKLETESDPAETEATEVESDAKSEQTEPLQSESLPEPTEPEPVKEEPSLIDAIPQAVGDGKRQIRGNVVSKSGHKSIVVLVERKVKHPLYKKYIKRSNKLHAHDENNESSVGDIVSLESCRPISKTKCWRLVEVVSHVQ